MTLATKETCPHCNGRVELVGQGSGRPKVLRCATCGRSTDPSATNGHTPTSAPAPRAFVDLAPGSAQRPCSVKGCPGKLDARGACPCCVKRAAWAEENIPRRQCEICDGEITGPGNRKLCDACRPVKTRANAATFRAGEAAPRTKKT